MSIQITYSLGKPYPLGTSMEGKKVNIAVVMHPEKEGGILLYRGSGTKESMIKIPFTEENGIGDVYSISILGINCKRDTYLFYEDDRTFVDPYAKRVVGNDKWHPYANGFSKEKEVHLRGGFVEENFDWEGDYPLMTPYEDSIIYCLHTRGFTKDPSSKVKAKGTFAGIMEKIPYLKELGITAIELMPSYEFLEDRILPESNHSTKSFAASMEDAVNSYKELPGEDLKKTKFDYWGYQQGYYFSPKASYAYSKDPSQEFRSLVKTMHQNGIEVLMQFYFPKTIIAADILQVLKYWVFAYHVDGFRLKGAEIPFYLIAKDPMFTKTKLMYDDVPEHLLNPSGKAPSYKNLAYCSDDFSHLCRRYLKGDNDCLYAFTNFVRTVPQTIGVIRSITNYYGFRLGDLVSYEQKHNLPNGENNEDGVQYNYSWNCGVEGPTRKKTVLDLRMRQMKNALCLLFLSQGTPFFMSGDEFAHSQDGNNNPYNQDNGVSWLNWRWNQRQKELFAFSKQIIALRKSGKAFRQDGKLSVSDRYQCGYPGISYHADELWRVDMAEYNHHIGLLYVVLDEKGKQTSQNSSVKRGLKEEKVNLCYTYVLYNMHWNEHAFALPPIQGKLTWKCSLFTGNPKQEEKIVLQLKEQQSVQHLIVPERSVVVLTACR